ncbi:MAG: hypothetical protein KGL59_07780, partial [Acidobacteriota bacterium]|nr:hypothetical protein [Acidobacteriota bacterium]
IEFLDALQSSPAFSHIRVNSESRAAENGGPDQVDVDLDAVYSGAMPQGDATAPEHAAAPERARAGDP